MTINLQEQQFDLTAKGKNTGTIHVPWINSSNNLPFLKKPCFQLLNNTKLNQKIPD